MKSVKQNLAEQNKVKFIKRVILFINTNETEVILTLDSVI